MLFATVRNRKIHVKKPDTVVQNGVNVDYLVLDMDDEWAEMDSIVCVFTNRYTEEQTAEDGTNSLVEQTVEKEMLHTFGQKTMVPWEVLVHSGKLSVSCTGYVGDEKIMTTMYPDSFWDVVQSGPMSGDETIEPTASLYDQIVAAAGSANAAAIAANEAREQLLQDKANGVFDGENGQAATVEIGNVTTTDPDVPAKVYNSGTETAVTLNFELPRGPRGPKGDTGPRGSDGVSPRVDLSPFTRDGRDGVQIIVNNDGSDAPQMAIVYDGEKGEAGPQGPQGDAGPAGAAGPQGPRGVSGVYVGSGEMPEGYNVQIDPDGTPGESGTGTPGGYYAPSVTQPDANTMRISFTPSDASMPAVQERDVALPQGPAGADGKDGANGADGKTAYQYAQDGGYTGTEEAFAAKMAAEMPDKLPNPNPLTFTGAVEGTYDGSEQLEIEIPNGGAGSDFALVLDTIIPAGATVHQYSLPKAMNNYKELFFEFYVAAVSATIDLCFGHVTAASGSNRLAGQMSGTNRLCCVHVKRIADMALMTGSAIGGYATAIGYWYSGYGRMLRPMPTIERFTILTSVETTAEQYLRVYGVE